MIIKYAARENIYAARENIRAVGELDGRAGIAYF